MTVPPGPADAAPEITAWLHAAAAGDSAAEEQLLRALYDDLHRLARKRIRAERRDHTLQPTGLVHEAYVRLMRGANIDWNDRAHFFAAASTAMRRVLVDHARRRTATKRGSGVAAVELGEGFGMGEPNPEIQDLLRGSVGLNFGLEYLPGAIGFEKMS